LAEKYGTVGLLVLEVRGNESGFKGHSKRWNNYDSIIIYQDDRETAKGRVLKSSDQCAAIFRFDNTKLELNCIPKENKFLGFSAASTPVMHAVCCYATGLRLLLELLKPSPSSFLNRKQIGQPDLKHYTMEWSRVVYTSYTMSSSIKRANALPANAYTMVTLESSQPECIIICLEEMSGPVARLDCAHQYHLECLKETAIR
jgi:hypothetical protein